ncbi:MAG TPA: hypothetical protein VLD40_04115 [Dissulfurispiraceae bacterium]|nr:hypothetical protein [Dissulfurispiraceae bacterium]
MNRIANALACRELPGCHIGTPEGMKCTREKKLFSTRCSTFVRDAAETVETMLQG